MLFSDLKSLPYDAQSGKLCAETLRRLLPDTPDDVAEQVYVDHGRKQEHQDWYGQFDLSLMQWALAEMRADELVRASVQRDFEPWTQNVAARARDVRSRGWGAVDVRPAVSAHWQQHGTWIRPPVLLAGELATWGAPLHLLEGHTRLGLLRGLLSEGLLAAGGLHQAWIGRMRCPWCGLRPR